jgi:hypothetical protein
MPRVGFEPTIGRRRLMPQLVEAQCMVALKEPDLLQSDVGLQRVAINFCFSVVKLSPLLRRVWDENFLMMFRVSTSLTRASFHVHF